LQRLTPEHGVLGAFAIVVLIAVGCGNRLDLPQEPQAGGGPAGDLAYFPRYVWTDVGRIEDLVLISGQLYGVVDSSRVRCWFSDAPQPRLNPGRSIPSAVFGTDSLLTPVKICKGIGNTLWVAYRFPRPRVAQWNIGVVPPVRITSGFVQPDSVIVFGGIAADDDSGFVYISDSRNSTISAWAPSETGGRRVAILATPGTGDRFFTRPGGMYFYSDSLLVADTGGNRLQVIHAYVPNTGRGEVTGPREDPLQLRSPLDVWIDASGYYYVSDAGNGRTLQLSTAGTIREIVNQYDQQAANTPNSVVATGSRVWASDPDGRGLTIYELNDIGEELP
jgi:hypothetical protein